MHGGGRAGVHVGGWENAGYNLEDLEAIEKGRVALKEKVLSHPKSQALN